MTSLSLVVLGASILGALVSLYFVLVAYSLLSPNGRFIPPVCRMDEGSCASLLRTPESRIFGVPNFFLGMLYYGALAVLAIIPSGLETAAIPLMLVSSVTVAMAIQLTYALLFRLKVRCVLCFAGHIINLVIFGAILTFV